MRRSFLFFLLAIASCFATTSVSASNLKTSNFEDSSIQKEIDRFLIPRKHPMKPILDKIFAKPGVLKNVRSFKKAGFQILLHKRATRTHNAYWYMARHPLVPGYLFKIFLDNETRLRRNEGWQKLLDRCKGAERIRNLIQKERIRNFIVPNKWLYKVPRDLAEMQPVILMVTDMDLPSPKKIAHAWKRANKKQIHELFIILSHGLSSPLILKNIPYTRKGKFSCLDTEGHVRKLRLEKANPYFSHDMLIYWQNLIKTYPTFVGEEE